MSTRSFIALSGVSHIETYELPSEEEDESLDYPLTQRTPPMSMPSRRIGLDLNASDGDDEAEEEIEPTTLAQAFPIVDDYPKDANGIPNHILLLDLFLGARASGNTEIAHLFCMEVGLEVKKDTTEEELTDLFVEWATNYEEPLEPAQTRSIHELPLTENEVIRAQQDQEYFESLRTDQDKEKKRIAEEAEQVRIEENYKQTVNFREAFDNMEKNKKRALMASFFEDKFKKAKVSSQ